MGFPSRCMLVFSKDKVESDFLHSDQAEVELPVDFFGQQEDSTSSQDLVRELRAISLMFGQYKVHPDTIPLWQEIKDCVETGCNLPDMAKLEGYKIRRVSHVAKAAMCIAAGRREERVILMEDVEYALDLFHRTEVMLPQLIQDMAQDSDKGVIDEAWSHLMQRYQRTKRPISEHILTSYLAQKVSTGRIRFILDSMVHAYMIKEVEAPTKKTAGGNEVPTRFAKFKHYVPMTVEERGIDPSR